METTGKQLEWEPDTGHNVPQPAGKHCADWYTEFVPSAETILYALAHTKGEADRLRALNAELVAALESFIECRAAVQRGDYPELFDVASELIAKAKGEA